MNQEGTMMDDERADTEDERMERRLGVEVERLRAEFAGLEQWRREQRAAGIPDPVAFKASGKRMQAITVERTALERERGNICAKLAAKREAERRERARLKTGLSVEAYQAACKEAENDLREEFEDEPRDEAAWAAFLDEAIERYVDEHEHFLEDDFYEGRKEEFEYGLKERVESRVQERAEQGFYKMSE